MGLACNCRVRDASKAKKSLFIPIFKHRNIHVYSVKIFAAIEFYLSPIFHSLTPFTVVPRRVYPSCSGDNIGRSHVTSSLTIGCKGGGKEDKIRSMQNDVFTASLASLPSILPIHFPSPTLSLSSLEKKERSLFLFLCLFQTG